MIHRRTCFIVMPIGDQEFADHKVSAVDLKKRYDDLIKEALLRADPLLDITRSDDVTLPGTITSDILTRLMHSDIVVADVTYPNPNVFYELGLRHACRVGTIIIRDKDGPRAPFDIAHLRHIEYENSPSGLKALAARFEQILEHFAKTSGSTDNQFQELAKLTQYAFPDYVDRTKESEPEETAIIAMMQSPEILDLFLKAGSGEKVDQLQLISAMAKNPAVMGSFAKVMVKSGQFSLSPSTPTKHSQLGQTPNRASRRKDKRR